MQVILLEHITNLGLLGDVVNVKSGYGRNYLIPYGKALASTKANQERFEQKRAEYEQKMESLLADVQRKAAQLERLELSVEVLTGEDGRLYGSVTTMQIAELIAKEGITVNKREIILPQGAIRNVGIYEIIIRLSNNVEVTKNIEVRSENIKEIVIREKQETFVDDEFDQYDDERDN